VLRKERLGRELLCNEKLYRLLTFDLLRKLTIIYEDTEINMIHFRKQLFFPCPNYSVDAFVAAMLALGSLFFVGIVPFWNTIGLGLGAFFLGSLMDLSSRECTRYKNERLSTTWFPLSVLTIGAHGNAPQLRKMERVHIPDTAKYPNGLISPTFFVKHWFISSVWFLDQVE